MTSADRPLPAWLTVTTAAPAAAGTLDGRACCTRAAFFTEAARALPLPPYFGRNWDALYDSLRDLTPRALTVTDAEHLLADEPPAQFAALLALLGDARCTVTLVTPAPAALETRLLAAL
ncbi:barstar (barnase inhibitor) [Actinocorallia herbida]|uniref:Barstar (Barnase inhibitor) n=1 Tax=Actinocorallia herbida TaxID=58109 RepID=A0A3N1CWH2_9ACTN|nr:barstar family protein [Actinocorallia herbida]ROO85633.1 barstar (barnase inhibitor) [Actinocorallia herbida]